MNAICKASGIGAHDSVILKLLGTFKSETGLDAKIAPDQFSSWFTLRPKPTPVTKRQYLLRAAKLLGVDVPISPSLSANIRKPGSTYPYQHLHLLTRETYQATIARLNKTNRTDDLGLVEKRVGLCLFICVAITGYPLADVLTASSFNKTQSGAQNEWSCDLTINLARRNKKPCAITTHYHGLNELEISMMEALVGMSEGYQQAPEFYNPIHRKAFGFIATANPVKECSLWDMRRMYPQVLGYKHD